MRKRFFVSFYMQHFFYYYDDESQVYLCIQCYVIIEVMQNDWMSSRDEKISVFAGHKRHSFYVSLETSTSDWCA